MTETRNSLLAQIVVASGGEVRNPHDRNMLLEDWLLSVQNSACKVYLFSSANSDSLEIESFTGNLKVMIAAPAETGINPDIIAGRQGDFVASADPVNEPTIVQYEINAVNVTQIVDNTFNGIVYGYAKDNVWYLVDMGAPPIDYWPFDGVVTDGLQWGWLEVDGFRCIQNDVLDVGKEYLVNAEFTGGSGSIQLRIGGSQIVLSQSNPVVDRLVSVSSRRIEAVAASDPALLIGGQLNCTITES